MIHLYQIEWTSGHHDNIHLIAVQENQLQSDQHKFVENDPDMIDYPIHSYGLYTPPMGRSNKLRPKHNGRKHTDQCTRLQFLTLYIQPIPGSPEAVAQQNEQEFVVEEILAHRGNHYRRSTMEFFVQWTGCGEGSNSWESYKASMNVNKLHDYLRERRMRSLIPRENKQ